MELEGRRCIVTGASAGIGRAVAVALAARGVSVGMCARREVALRETADLCAGHGVKVHAGVCDIADADAVASFVAESVSALGGLDVLINNAGALGPRAPVRELSVDDFRDCVHTNVVGTFTVTRAALPHLLVARPGAILNLSSGLGRFGVARSSAYCASKFAIEGFTQSLADEHPGEELVVLAVSPGMVATDMLRSYLETPDVSDHVAADDVARGFVQLIERLGPTWTGRSVEIADYR